MINLFKEKHFTFDSFIQIYWNKIHFDLVENYLFRSMSLVTVSPCELIHCAKIVIYHIISIYAYFFFKMATNSSLYELDRLYLVAVLSLFR